MYKSFFLLALVFLVAGCMQPVVDLGCCMRENASKGCVLYNTTDFTTHPEFLSKTIGPCDSNDTQYNTSGHCKVSIDSKEYLVPICTQNQIVPCIGGNCTAMVCGDFKYKPRAPPSFTTPDDAKGAIPPDLDTETVQQFYKAQCRFLPMDAKLRQIMKNSNSQINVFRFGVGGSFDEFDNYRYYFPLSDKFCGSLNGVSIKDRYQNYISADGKIYDPEKITENCIDDSSNLIQTPYGFSDEKDILKVLPTKSGYKFANFIISSKYIDRLDVSFDKNFSAWAKDGPGFSSYYKSIDESFYKTALPAVYGLTSGKSTAANFECDSSLQQCYSGKCDISSYSRSTFIYNPDPNTALDVQTLCFPVSDSGGAGYIICPPLKSIPTSSDPFKPPIPEYAGVTVYPVLETILNPPKSDYQELTEKKNYLSDWDGANVPYFSGNLLFKGYASSGPTKITKLPDHMTFDYISKKDCKSSYGDTKSEDKAYCVTDFSTSSQSAPPAASVVFFGKPARQTATYTIDVATKFETDVIIGYAVVSKEDFKSLPVVKNCGITDNDVIYINPTLSTDPQLGDNRLNQLRKTFRPLYEQILDSYISEGNFEDDCGDQMAHYDAMMSAMPWILNVNKLGGRAQNSKFEFDSESNLLNSRTYDLYRTKNPYQEETVQTKTPTSCNLRQRYRDGWSSMGSAISNNLVLFKYTPGSNKIGKCIVDESTYLPKLRTYGWCQSCTSSTLAYQNISASKSNPYAPILKSSLTFEKGSFFPTFSDFRTLCTYSFRNKYPNLINCENPTIPDLKDFGSNLGKLGSPRTEPNAAILKERAVTYMKSGILPVFDLSDSTNWNKLSPYDNRNYDKYDFENLIGNLGASVTIIDRISESNFDLSRLEQRSSLVRQVCRGCLIAIHVNSPKNNATFQALLKQVLSDPLINYNVDVISFDYSISDHPENLNDPKKASEQIQSFSRAALQSFSKPSLLVGLSVGNVPTYTKKDYQNLFDAITLDQGNLVKSGLFGIIYSPVTDAEKGLVTLDSDGFSTRTPKFCAIEKSLQRMTSSSSTSIFTKVAAKPSIECEKCTASDISQLNCGASAMICADGSKCSLPSGLSQNDAKCPADTVGANCPLCSDLSGKFECTFDYSNGSSSTINGNLKDIDSETYLDILGGLDKPNKCCIGTKDSKYTFTKKVYTNPVNKPIVFPKDGNNETDCGFGSTQDAAALSGFCGIPLPLKDYDVKCIVK